MWDIAGALIDNEIGQYPFLSEMQQQEWCWYHDVTTMYTTEI